MLRYVTYRWAFRLTLIAVGALVVILGGGDIDSIIDYIGDWLR